MFKYFDAFSKYGSGFNKPARRVGRETNAVILQNCFSSVSEAARTYLGFSAGVEVGVTNTGCVGSVNSGHGLPEQCRSWATPDPRNHLCLS